MCFAHSNARAISPFYPVAQHTFAPCWSLGKILALCLVVGWKNSFQRKLAKVEEKKSSEYRQMIHRSVLSVKMFAGHESCVFWMLVLVLATNLFVIFSFCDAIGVKMFCAFLLLANRPRSFWIAKNRYVHWVSLHLSYSLCVFFAIDDYTWWFICVYLLVCFR